MDAARTPAVGKTGARAASNASGSRTIARPGSTPSRRTRSASGGDNIGALRRCAGTGAGRLHAVQGGIAPVGVQQLAVRAALAQAAVVEIENQVCPSREPQVVGDQEGGPSLRYAVQSLDHGALVCAVQARGGLVEDK